MRTIPPRLRAAAAAIALSLALSSAQTLAAPALSRLRGVDELKSWFNAAKGHPRLVLLLSPT